MTCFEWLEQRPLIGMVHLRALPGSPDFKDWDAVCGQAGEDARLLVEAGFSALILENLGDAPFYPQRVPTEVATHMTAVACALRQAHPQILLGINVLRNDGVSAVCIAAASGANFVRVNVMCGARLTDQGIIQGIAHEVTRTRHRLNVPIAILADVDVKHSSPLTPVDFEQEIEDTSRRGGADALIVSGDGTGQPTSIEQVRLAKLHTDLPVLVGSGVDLENIAALAASSDGLIVGSSIKQHGKATEAVDPQRAADIVRLFRTSC